MTDVDVLTEKHLAVWDAIALAIRGDKQHFDMSDWIKIGFYREEESFDAELLPEQDPKVCGTTLCLAGWAAHLDGWVITQGAIAYRKEDRQGSATFVEKVGRETLGLTTGHYYDGLFYSTEERVREFVEFVVEHRRIPEEDEIWRPE